VGVQGDPGRGGEQGAVGGAVHASHRAQGRLRGPALPLRSPPHDAGGVRSGVLRQDEGTRFSLRAGGRWKVPRVSSPDYFKFDLVYCFSNAANFRNISSSFVLFL